MGSSWQFTLLKCMTETASVNMQAKDTMMSLSGGKIQQSRLSK